MWPQLRRLRSPAIVAVSLAAAVALIDRAGAGLASLAGERQDPPMFWDFVTRCGAQVAAAEQVQAAEPAPLVVICGVSSVLRGLDGHTLHAADPEQRRWLVLGAGGKMRQLERYGEILDASALRPDCVLVGIHRMMLALEKPGVWAQADPSDPDFADQAGAATATWGLQRRLFRNAWLGRERKRILNDARFVLYTARMRLLGAWGLPVSVTFAASPDPWAPFEIRPAEHEKPELLATEWERLGYRCTAVSYARRDWQAAALARHVATLRRRTPDVRIVLMPEHSQLRTAYESAADAALAEALEKAGAGVPLPVIDLRDALADELFFDYSHPNLAGREKLSTLLPALVR